MSVHDFNERHMTPADNLYSVEEIRAMQRAIIRLFDHWGIKNDQAAVLLGGISPRTYQRWKSGSFGRIKPGLEDRLSNLLGIHIALRTLHSNPLRSYEWVKRPNTKFDGQSALDFMLKSGQLEDLVQVRQYLDGVCNR